MNDILVIYHKSDFDGKCSAAIAAAAHQGDVDFYGFGHYDEINWTLIYQYKEVIMVDICFDDVTDMIMLNNMCDLTWIDHHVSAINNCKNMDIKGLRRVGTAACELCWEFFFPHITLPYGVKHIALNDIWNQTDKYTLPFQYGMRYLNIKAEDQEIWKKIFFGDAKLLDEILEVGEVCFNYEKSSNKVYASQAYTGKFEGYNCVFLNGPNKGSLAFESVNGSDYDMMVVYNFNGEIWKVTMYSEKVDVSKIALKYGGGGHAAAAGFKSEEFPF